MFHGGKLATDNTWQALLGTERPCDRDVDEGGRRRHGEMRELLVRESVWEFALKVALDKWGFAFSGMLVAFSSLVNQIMLMNVC